ncbi:hypothetical protein F2P79_023415 [Pimephales promelas]|nr:hypothetical protein F2P79_023415 [Pimephales promelas]
MNKRDDSGRKSAFFVPLPLVLCCAQSGCQSCSWRRTHCNDQVLLKIFIIFFRRGCGEQRACEMTPVSEKEGDPVILHTRLILHINDQIKWMFNGQLIPEINEGTNGRLYLDRPSGSLIITKSKITDSGVYQLNMISSSHTVQRDISVTVIVSAQQTPDPGLSSGALAGIVGGVVLLVSAVLAAVVIYQCRTISKLRRDMEKNGTNDPLNDKTVNSDDL